VTLFLEHFFVCLSVSIPPLFRIHIYSPVTVCLYSEGIFKQLHNIWYLGMQYKRESKIQNRILGLHSQDMLTSEYKLVE
jgi:hypothetical protein